MKNIEGMFRDWASSILAAEPDSDTYCPTRDMFQARLETMQSKLSRIMPIETVSLVTAIAGEIGNNSYDHNLGNWPDITEIFFSYIIRSRKMVLADRGQGILSTLRRVRPELANSTEAMKVAFTETVSGRYPESRGNGLKFVRSAVINNPLHLYSDRRHMSKLK